MWYPTDPKELNRMLDQFLKIDSTRLKFKSREIHGLIVPHAGYQYSGEIAGKAYSLLKNKKIKRAIILAPTHQFGFQGIAKLPYAKTPLGKIKIIKSDIKEIPGLNYEHAVDNQLPFLQKLDIEEILPIVVGYINEKEIEQAANNILKYLNGESILIISTDLSHFLPYEEAVKKDKQTIRAIESLDPEQINENSACGFFPLLILVKICKIKKWKPKLIQYKNSGDITGDKSGVVGYGSLIF